MRTILEFLLAVIGAAALIYLSQHPVVQQAIQQVQEQQIGHSQPEPAVLITTAKLLRLRPQPTLDGTDCRCMLRRGDRLEFLQTVSDRTYKVPGKDGYVYNDPLYKVRVLDSADPACNGLQGWVFGGYIAWEPLIPALATARASQSTR